MKDHVALTNVLVAGLEVEGYNGHHDHSSELYCLEHALQSVPTYMSTPSLLRTRTKTLDSATLSNPILSVWAKSLMVSFKIRNTSTQSIWSLSRSLSLPPTSQYSTARLSQNSSTSGRTNLSKMDTTLIDPYSILPIRPPNVGTLKFRGGFQSIVIYTLVSGTGPVTEL